MHAGKLLLGALLALCLVLCGQQARSQEKDVGYTMVIKKVAVEKTKADGSSWDINDGAPDLCVVIRNIDDKDSKAYTTKTKDDVFEADFNEPTNIRFRQGQTLEFEVLDKDVAVNDTIGKLRKEMSAELLKKEKLRFEKFDRVIYLEVEFKKL